jgi:uncharacterized protein (UPF0333 family)
MPKVAKMNERAQGATEYLLMLGAVLVLVAGIVTTIFLTSQTLGSSVSGQIDNVMDNVIIPGLAGVLS